MISKHKTKVRLLNVLTSAFSTPYPPSPCPDHLSLVMKHLNKIKNSAIWPASEEQIKQELDFGAIVKEAYTALNDALSQGWPDWRRKLVEAKKNLTSEFLPQFARSLEAETETMVSTQLPRLLRHLCAAEAKLIGALSPLLAF